MQAREKVLLKLFTDKRLGEGSLQRRGPVDVYCDLDCYAGQPLKERPYSAPPPGPYSRRPDTIERYLNKLVDAGYLTVRDSAAGKRYALTFYGPPKNARWEFSLEEVVIICHSRAYEQHRHRHSKMKK